MALKLAPATERGNSRTITAVRVLAGVVAGIALLAGAFVLGRYSVPRSGVSSEAAVADGREASEGSDAQSAAPADESTPEVGPTRVVSDVPVGYARSREGAVAAATGYLAAIGDKRAFNTEWRVNAYRAMADPAVVDDLLDSVDESYQRIDGDLGLGDAVAYDGSVLAVTIPVGYRVDAYDDDRATITVWAAGWLTRLSGPQLPLRAQTSTLELVWLDGDWKLADVSGIEPLDPPGVAAPVTPQALAEMRGFHAYSYEPQVPT